MTSQIWLISGSGSGLGRDIAEAALAAGHRVVATARRTQALDDLVAKHSPETLRVFPLDVADPLACEAAVRFAIEQFGQLDVLVNNAGYGQLSPFENMPVDDFRAQIETNLFGVVNLTRAALPGMRERRSGHIINVSSVGGRATFAGMSAYQSAKFAVGGFSEVLSKELEGLGVAVTAIEPGGMRTGFVQRAGGTRAVYHADYEPNIGPLHAMLAQYDGNEPGDPRRVAEVVVGLAAHPKPPVRLLLGSDALQWASSAVDERKETDDRWLEVSRATDFGDAAPLPVFPAY